MFSDVVKHMCYWGGGGQIRTFSSAKISSILQKWILKYIIHNFFYQLFFFHAHWRLTGQQRKGGDHFLFHFTTSTRSRTFRHLFATLHVRWLSHIFNCNARIYQTATRWYFTTLSNYHLIDWWCRIVDNGFALISV